MKRFLCLVLCLICFSIQCSSAGFEPFASQPSEHTTEELWDEFQIANQTFDATRPHALVTKTKKYLEQHTFDTASDLQESWAQIDKHHANTPEILAHLIYGVYTAFNCNLNSAQILSIALLVDSPAKLLIAPHLAQTDIVLASLAIMHAAMGSDVVVLAKNADIAKEQYESSKPLFELFQIPGNFAAEPINTQMVTYRSVDTLHTTNNILLFNNCASAELLSARDTPFFAIQNTPEIEPDLTEQYKILELPNHQRIEEAPNEIDDIEQSFTQIFDQMFVQNAPIPSQNAQAQVEAVVTSEILPFVGTISALIEGPGEHQQLTQHYEDAMEEYFGQLFRCTAQTETPQDLECTLPQTATSTQEDKQSFDYLVREEERAARATFAGLDEAVRNVEQGFTPHTTSPPTLPRIHTPTTKGEHVTNETMGDLERFYALAGMSLDNVQKPSQEFFTDLASTLDSTMQLYGLNPSPSDESELDETSSDEEDIVLDDTWSKDPDELSDPSSDEEDDPIKALDDQLYTDRIENQKALQDMDFGHDHTLPPTQKERNELVETAKDAQQSSQQYRDVLEQLLSGMQEHSNLDPTSQTYRLDASDEEDAIFYDPFAKDSGDFSDPSIDEDCDELPASVREESENHQAPSPLPIITKIDDFLADSTADVQEAWADLQAEYPMSTQFITKTLTSTLKVLEGITWTNPAGIVTNLSFAALNATGATDFFLQKAESILKEMGFKRSAKTLAQLTLMSVQHKATKRVGTSSAPRAPPKKRRVLDDATLRQMPQGRMGGKKTTQDKKWAIDESIHKPTTINGRHYTSHALSRMMQRGFTPSVVEDVLHRPKRIVQDGQELVYYSANNSKLRVITSLDSKRIVTIKFADR